MSTQVDIKALWDKVVERIKLKIIHPTLWRTLEDAVPVVIDGDEFVVGFPPASFHLSGNLNTSEHKNAIETALKEYSGLQLNLHIIDGTTLPDWMNVKAKEESLRKLRETAQQKRAAEAAITKSWDSLLETVSRRYANTPLRQFPQSRARYIEEMLQEISDTMNVLMPPGSSDEIAERTLARVIDKVGAVTEVPPAMIALELLRYRNSR